METGLRSHQRTVADPYLPGPAPHLELPAITRAAEAENSLRHALRLNAERGGLVSGITPAQAETLLGWITYTTRMALTCPSLLRNNHTEPFSPEHLEGLCCEADAMVGLQAQQMGIRTFHHQLSKLTHGGYFGHGFSVLTLAVVEDGVAVAKPYLVDTTFRQFFSTKRRDSLLSKWGEKLAATEEGRALADSLLTHGYIALTPEVAERYVSTADIDRYCGTHIDHHYPNLMDDLLTQSTIFSGIGPKTARHDMRSPSRVLDGAPLSAAIDAYRAHASTNTAGWWNVPAASLPDIHARPVLQEDALRMHDPDTHDDYVAAYARMRKPTPHVTEPERQGAAVVPHTPQR